MEDYIENEIRLCENSKHKSLYSWSLQEFNKEGKKIGVVLQSY